MLLNIMVVIWRPLNVQKPMGETFIAMGVQTAPNFHKYNSSATLCHVNRIDPL